MEILYLSALISLLVLVVVLIFLGTVQPLWALFDCISNKNQGSRKKSMWVMVIALAWTFSTLIYGLFVTRSKWLRRISQFCFAVSLVAGITTISVASAVPAVRAQLSNIVDKAIAEGSPRNFLFFNSRYVPHDKAVSGKVSVEEYGRKVLDSLQDANTPFDLKKFQISTLHLLGDEIRPTLEDALRYYRQKPAAQLNAQDKELVGLLENELRRLRSSS